MWIQVRSMDGKQNVRIDSLSKLTKIEELREKLVEHFDASPDRQRLFYRGKQLVDGHTLFDYNVGLNEIIQIMVRAALPPVAPSPKKSVPSAGEESDKENQEPNATRVPAAVVPDTEPMAASSQDSGFDEETDSVYKMGDIIDARDETMGAWFEARILKVTRGELAKNNDNSTDSKTESKSEESLKNSEESKSEENHKKSEECKSDENKDSEESPMDTEEICDDNKKVENENIKNSESDKLSNNDCNGNVIKDSEPSEDTSSSQNSNPSDEKKDLNDSQDKPADTKPTESSQPAEPLKHPWDTKLAKDDGYVYTVLFEGYEDDDAVELSSRHIRPRARHVIPFKAIEVGSEVMVNFNYDEPTERGYWYDAIVTSKRSTRTIKEVNCTIFIGKDLVPMSDCLVLFRDEIFEIEMPGTQLNLNQGGQSPAKRTNKPNCDHCQDNPRRKCKECSCHECGSKDNPDKTLLCDECDMAYHIFCLDPPLESIPDVDEWYCPLCKNDATEVVQAGEKLKESKKKSKMASAKSTSNRDWGKGMACVGRTKMCTIVPPNHFGSIPGIEVGSLWKFRVQVSEAGCHRPHVAGIHGREENGAFSIVLSGGYEDDQDDGEEFTYTGSGGRDLSGNKRTAEQSCDQQLTRMNLALARNCNCPPNAKKGGDAGDKWRDGKPVRVVRNCKGAKHSEYAPEEGNRYDGIYKVVKYWQEAGKSGFKVWRYMLRRDDPNPAPWTKAGKKKIKELGLNMVYPEGWLEAQAEKEKNTPAKGKKGKRKRDEEDVEETVKSPSTKGTPAKKRAIAYKLEEDVAGFIENDSSNKKIWDEALTHTKEGAQTFISKVEELFSCICCQDLVYKPITTECSHNVCKSCLARSFKAEVYTCPACRHELGEKYSMATNKPLTSALQKLFPGYENGRD